MRLGPGAGGRGLSLRLGSTWGAPSSATERLWSQRGAAGLAVSGEFEAKSRLEAEVGYGVAALGGVLTPYTGLSVSGAGGTYRVGGRFELGEHLSMSLEGERIERDLGGPQHQVGLRVRALLGGAGALPSARKTAALTHAPERERPPTRYPGAAEEAAVGIAVSPLHAPAEEEEPDALQKEAPGPGYRLQFGAFSQNARAVRAKRRLEKYLPDLLGGGRALEVHAPAGDGFRRVVLTYVFGEREDAAGLCERIRARGEDCYVRRVR